MESVRINKPDAASQQLDVAIATLFTQDNAVVVQTLAGAAAAIVAETNAATAPVESWHIAARQACGVGGEQFTEIMQFAAEHARQAGTAPYSIERFTLAETTGLLVSTIFGVGQIRGKLTISQCVFVLWNLACRLSALGPEFRYKQQIRSCFGNLGRKSLKYRLVVGRRVLLAEMDRIAGSTN